jgi:proteasome accessory factor C
MSEPAARQLERVLYLLPAAARDGGVRVVELARALGCSAEDVLSLITEITERAYYQPAGSVEPFTISIESERVTVYTNSEFRRPVRLSPREALAVSLGLRALAAEATAEERGRVLALAARLEEGLRVPEVAPAAGDVVRAPLPRYDADGGFTVAEPAAEFGPRELEVSVGDDDLRAVLADAVRDRQRVRISYLKPGDAAPSERDIAPYVLAYAEGAWYTIAADGLLEKPKIFRLDRVLSVDRLPEPFQVPPSFSPASFVSSTGGLFRAAGESHARVRYSPKVARWVAERVSCERLSDGSVVVEHRVADPQWLWRHVLMYGGEAVVVGTAT